MSIELDTDPQAEIARAQAEAREAVARARRVVERSRRLFLHPSSPAERSLLSSLPHHG